MTVSKQRFKELAKRFVDKTFSEFTESYTIEQSVKTPDGQGGFTVAWSTFATITGFVKTTSANKITLDDHIKSLDLKTFSFEFIGGIDTLMRIVYLGDEYNIHKVISIQDSTVWIDIVASKKVAT